MTINKGYFDTNILVGISLLDMCQSFYEVFTQIKIAEQVSIEFDRWNIEGYSYRKIYTDVRSRIASEHIEVVENKSFSEDIQAYIDYKTDAIKSGEVSSDDLGEIHSVIMAEIHQAPYFCTNDNKFIRKHKATHFPELEIRDLSFVLKNIHGEDEELIKSLLSQEQREHQLMNQAFKKLTKQEKHKFHNGLPDEEMKKLNAFKVKYT